MRFSTKAKPYRIVESIKDADIPQDIKDELLEEDESKTIIIVNNIENKHEDKDGCLETIGGLVVLAFVVLFVMGLCGAVAF